MRTHTSVRCFGAIAAAVVTSVSISTWPAAGGGPPPPAPSTVYVYNGGPNNEGHKGDGYTNAAIGWAWQAIGWVGGQAQSYEVAELDGTDLKLGGQIVGHAIVGDFEILGFESADGTKRVYNIDTSATLDVAWKAVSSTGMLIIAKHGGRQLAADDTPLSTFITLDGGRKYAGVKDAGTDSPGTGYPNGPVYPLTPRPGAQVSVDINACFSNNDPDDDGPKKSVVATFKTVTGVKPTAVTGHDGLTDKTVSIRFLAADEAKATAALKACALKAGFKRNGVGEPALWIWHTAFPSQRQALVDCLIDAEVNFTRVGVRYAKNGTEPAPAGVAGTDPDSDGGMFGYYLPLRDVGYDGAAMRYDPGSGYEKIGLDIPRGSLIDPRVIFLHPLPLEPDRAVLPCGTMPATYLATIEEYRGLSLSFATPATLTITNQCDYPIQGFYRLVGTTLVPHAYMASGGVIAAPISVGGTYVTLRETPLALRADLIADGVVNGLDLRELLGEWGLAGQADLNCDGTTNGVDLGLLLGQWNQSTGGTCQ